MTQSEQPMLTVRQVADILIAEAGYYSDRSTGRTLLGHLRGMGIPLAPLVPLCEPAIADIMSRSNARRIIDVWSPLAPWSFVVRDAMLTILRQSEMFPNDAIRDLAITAHLMPEASKPLVITELIDSANRLHLMDVVTWLPGVDPTIVDIVAGTMVSDGMRLDPRSVYESTRYGGLAWLMQARNDAPEAIEVALWVLAQSQQREAEDPGLYDVSCCPIIERYLQDIAARRPERRSTIATACAEHLTRQPAPEWALQLLAACGAGAS